MREWIEFLFFIAMLCGFVRLIVWAWRTELEQAEHLAEMQRMLDEYEAERVARERAGLARGHAPYPEEAPR